MLKKLEPNSFKKAAECPVHRPFRTTHLFILATLLGFTCLSQTNITQAAPYYAGAGFYGAPTYPYVAPLVYAPPEPMVMVSQAQPNVWYYCAPSKAYFPYVQSCTTDWQVLPAMPPSGAHELKPQ